MINPSLQPKEGETKMGQETLAIEPVQGQDNSPLLVGQTLRRTKRSRFQRVKPRPFWLQERDRKILASVFDHGALSTSQVADLFFNGSVDRASRRLRLLFDGRLLQRAFYPKGLGSPECLYLLEKMNERAVQIVSEEIGMKPGEIRRLSLPFNRLTEHFLEVNEFRVRLEITCQRQSGVLLEIWLSERECQDRYLLSEAKREKVFSPDGYFRLLKEGKLWSYFLEWDRGTEAPERIREKAETYAEYWKGGLYERRYGLKKFRVLFVTTKGERIEKLMEAVGEVSEAPPFWFTTSKEVKECPDILTSQIWRFADSTKRALLS